MKINVVDIRHEVGASREIDDEIFVPLDNEEKSQKILFKGRVSNVGKTFLLRGDLKASAELSCVRCLAMFLFEENIFVEEEYTERPPEVTPEMQWNSDELNVFSGNVIDITDTLRDTLLLHLPMQPVCSDGGCLGLCGKCGKNLNEGACGCAKEDIDPRLQKLQTLLEK